MTDPNTVAWHESQTHELYNPQMTSGYRRYDEEFIHTSSYKHFAGILTELVTSFPYPVQALDVGCGTGRYFHTLRNLSSLTGIDVSPNMLQEAQNPFRREDVPVSEIELIHGNFYHHDFGERSFDFIYSVGVLGEHAPFDRHVCAKLHSLLQEGGKLYFTVVDIEPRKNLKRRFAEAAYPLLPSPVKRILDKRWETIYMTWEQLEDIVKQQGFSSYSIRRHIVDDPKWKGVHLECIALK